MGDVKIDGVSSLGFFIYTVEPALRFTPCCSWPGSHGAGGDLCFGGVLVAGGSVCAAPTAGEAALETSECLFMCLSVCHDKQSSVEM